MKKLLICVSAAIAAGPADGRGSAGAEGGGGQAGNRDGGGRRNRAGKPRWEEEREGVEGSEREAKPIPSAALRSMQMRWRTRTGADPLH